MKLNMKKIQVHQEKFDATKHICKPMSTRNTTLHGGDGKIKAAKTPRWRVFHVSTETAAVPTSRSFDLKVDDVMLPTM